MSSACGNLKLNVPIELQKFFVPLAGARDVPCRLTRVKAKPPLAVRFAQP
jgi:hypothetical protein